VAHVELSLSTPYVPQARTPAESEFVPSVDRWTTAVATAAEPCLVIDASTTILAVSVSCCELFGLGKPAEAIGQPLGSALRMVDFTADGRELDESDAEKIPPLLAIRSERLARGLLRVVAGPGQPPVTVDAITTPLLTGDRLAGSLTFFAPIR